MFANCKAEAIEVWQNLPYETDIVYGLYKPKKPKALWDAGWASQAINEWTSIFTHFWLEKDDLIIDVGAEQFGEDLVVTTPKTDPHYTKVGWLDVAKDEYIPLVSQPKIRWPSKVNPLSPISVEWDDYDKYLADMRKAL